MDEGADSEEPSIADLVVVSNRQPYRHRFEGEGGDREVVVDRPTGGLVAGLDPVVQRLGGTWIAWGDGEADDVVSDDDNRVRVPPEDPSYTLQRVSLDEEDVERYYNGYANQTLWPLCHAAMGNVRFEREFWERYRAVNERFAAATAPHASAESMVWFQDYHLALAPRSLRADCDALLAHFWHVPWPSAEVFRTCPHHRELLDGLLANDLLGFHVDRYCENFLDCADELLPAADVDREAGVVEYGQVPTRVESFPLGIDVEGIERRARETPDAGERFREEHGIDQDRRLVLGVDRLDYTKGIPERLAALEYLWETTPELRGEFTYVQKGSESRSGVPAYRRLQDRVALAVERVNDRFGTDDWQPVVLTTEHLSMEDLCGLYRDADAALVTPLRDGMNLVAQEYVAAQVDGDGALVLSEFAGAHELMGDYAFSVNPRDTPGTAAAIERALRTDEEERRERMRRLRQHVAALDIDSWMGSIFRAAREARREREIGATEPVP